MYIIYLVDNLYFHVGDVVALSSCQYGLFMLSPRWSAIEGEEANLKKRGLQSRSRSIVSSNKGKNCPHLSETRQC